MSASDAKADQTEWIVSIRLGDMPDDEAEAWMEYITDAVWTRDNGFSGLVAMCKEPLE